MLKIFYCLLRLLNRRADDKNEKPDIIPKPIATPSLEESTPLPALADGSLSKPNDLIFPYESLSDKLKVRKAVVRPIIRKNIKRAILSLFI